MTEIDTTYPEEYKMASYDMVKMKPGYTGKFLIHDHNAERAGRHWDLRIEFPVTSLKKSLKKYDTKRTENNEPSAKILDKSGNVYRSFVDKNREIPTKDNKIYLIETEDHPISYGDFEGKIKEGYGKGTVKIWDKGTYKLIDSKGNKKFVINFQGKRLKGTYALIKYQKGYLWIKTKYQKKESSAIDYIRPTLPPQLWNIEKEPPILRNGIKKAIINTFINAFEEVGLKRPLSWLKGFYLTGSSTSFNYKEDGDVDIDIIYDPQILREQYPELKKLSDKDLLEFLRNIIYTKNSKNVNGTSHTFSYSVLKPDDKPISDNIYDIFKDKWNKVPIPLPLDFDPDNAFIKQKKIAITIARKIDLLIGEIIRTLDDMKRVDQYNKFYGKYNIKRVILRFRLKKLCTELNDWYNFIWNLQKEATENDKNSFYPAFDFSSNWKEKMIIFKYLARYGYHRCVSMLYSLLKDDPYLDIIDQYIPD